MNALARGLLLFHVAAGSLALAVGVFNLLLTPKGRALHVRTGKIFWSAMIAMAASGIVIAALRPDAVFILIGLLSLYLVQTGRNALTRPRGAVDDSSRFWLVVSASCLAAGIGLGVYGLATDGEVFGSSYALYLGVAFDAAIFVALDWRLISLGSAIGKSRLIDHVWRIVASLFFAMFALFVANTSVLPGWAVGSGLNFVPPLAVLMALGYWVLAVHRGWWTHDRSRSR